MSNKKIKIIFAAQFEISTFLKLERYNQSQHFSLLLYKGICVVSENLKFFEKKSLNYLVVSNNLLLSLSLSLSRVSTKYKQGIIYFRLCVQRWCVRFWSCEGILEILFAFFVCHFFKEVNH